MGIEMDVLFLTALFGNIVVHIFFLFKGSYFSLKESCKSGKCCKMCRKKSKSPQEIQKKTDSKPSKFLQTNLEVIHEEDDAELDEYKKQSQRENDNMLVEEKLKVDSIFSAKDKA